jgi:uncharacterized protein YndB with AHSA1/START domain
MEMKTKVIAEEGKQEILITREFDLPLELLFKAYEDPEILSQWMGTKVLSLESKQYGTYQFQTSDPNGNVLFKARGVIHTFIPNKKIIKTFEMENAPVGIQLEIYEFEALGEDRSKLQMHVLYESAALRDQVVQYGMAPGINMAHNRLEEVVSKLK